MVYTGVDLDMLPSRGFVGKTVTPRKMRDYVPLQGEVVTNRLDIEALYQLGDFRYQFQNPGPRFSRVMTCSSQAERDWIIREVALGAQLIVQVPTPE